MPLYNPHAYGFASTQTPIADARAPAVDGTWYTALNVAGTGRVIAVTGTVAVLRNMEIELTCDGVLIATATANLVGGSLYYVTPLFTFTTDITMCWIEFQTSMLIRFRVVGADTNCTCAVNYQLG